MSPSIYYTTFLPQALVLLPTAFQALQHLHLAATSSPRSTPKIIPLAMATLCVAEIGLVGAVSYYTKRLPDWLDGVVVAAPPTNWSAWWHFDWTTIHFSLFTGLTALFSQGKNPYLPLGLAAYQSYQLLQSSERALGGNISPSTLLDYEHLSLAFSYWKRNWAATAGVDIALGCAAWLSLRSFGSGSGVEKGGKEGAASKLIAVFFITFFLNALTQASPFLLTLPYAPLAFINYFVRPRLALYTIAFGVQMRSLVLETLASEKEGPVAEVKKVEEKKKQ